MKTHYELVFSEPDESDPEGWSEILCQIRPAHSFTQQVDQVTCKKCLKILEQRRMLPARQQGYSDFMNHIEFDPEQSVEWKDGWTYALYNNALAIKAKKLANDYIEGIK